MKKASRGDGETREAKKATRGAIRRDSVPTGGKAPGHRKMGKNLPLIPRPSERTIYRKAFDLANAGHTDRAASLLLKSHEQGDGRATYALATWHIHGKHFKVNKKKALILLKRAHRKSVREATFDLAYAYESGFGVAKSPSKAFRLYLDAASKGDPSAIKAVVRCVYYGVGFCKSKVLAFLIQDLAQELRSYHSQHPKPVQILSAHDSPP